MWICQKHWRMVAEEIRSEYRAVKRVYNRASEADKQVLLYDLNRVWYRGLDDIMGNAG